MIRHPRLTPQQQRVLELAAAGKAGKEIAHVLDISESAVRGHLDHARDRLGARSPSHAVLVYVEWRAHRKRRPVPVQDTTLELV